MSFWNNFFGSNGDPSAGFANTENQISQEYNPWNQQGLQASQFLNGQYQNNIQNPNQLQNQMAQGFYTSPYQQNLLNQTTNRMNMNSANTGMLGSGASNLALGNQLNNMTGQFQNDYVNRGMQGYQNNIQGMQGIAQMGMGALNQQTGLQEQAAIANMASQKQNNSFWPNAIGQIGGLVGTGASIYGMGALGGLWGGAGAAAGGAGAGSFMDSLGGDSW